MILVCHQDLSPLRGTRWTVDPVLPLLPPPFTRLVWESPALPLMASTWPNSRSLTVATMAMEPMAAMVPTSTSTLSTWPTRLMACSTTRPTTPTWTVSPTWSVRTSPTGTPEPRSPSPSQTTAAPRTSSCHWSTNMALLSPLSMLATTALATTSLVSTRDAGTKPEVIDIDSNT